MKEFSRDSTPRGTIGNGWDLKGEESVFSKDEPCDGLASTKRSALHTWEPQGVIIYLYIYTHVVILLEEYEAMCLRRSGKDMKGIGGGRKKGRVNIILKNKSFKKI